MLPQRQRTDSSSGALLVTTVRRTYTSRTGKQVIVARKKTQGGLPIFVLNGIVRKIEPSLPRRQGTDSSSGALLVTTFRRTYTSRTGKQVIVARKKTQGGLPIFVLNGIVSWIEPSLPERQGTGVSLCGAVLQVTIVKRTCEHMVCMHTTKEQRQQEFCLSVYTCCWVRAYSLNVQEGFSPLLCLVLSLSLPLGALGRVRQFLLEDRQAAAFDWCTVGPGSNLGFKNLHLYPSHMEHPCASTFILVLIKISWLHPS